MKTIKEIGIITNKEISYMGYEDWVIDKPGDLGYVFIKRKYGVNDFGPSILVCDDVRSWEDKKTSNLYLDISIEEARIIVAQLEYNCKANQTDFFKELKRYVDRHKEG